MPHHTETLFAQSILIDSDDVLVQENGPLCDWVIGELGYKNLIFKIKSNIFNLFRVLYTFVFSYS
jgi:hypothetical protein